MKINLSPGKMFCKLWRHFSAPALLCLVVFLAVSIEGFLPFESKTLRSTLDDVGTACLFGLALSTAICTLRTRLSASIPLSWVAGAAGAALYLLDVSAPLISALTVASLAICLWGARGKAAPALQLNQIFGWFFTCLGLSIVVWIALNVIQSAVISLFFSSLSSSISSGVTQAAGAFSFLLFAPWMFLGRLPDEDTPVNKRLGFHKFNVRVLLPLSLMLMAVLLAYVAKIAITWTMPVGTMNGFALAALALFTFFHLTLTGEDGRIARWYCKWCGWLMLPVLIAQQVGVWIRVEAYGLTEARVLGIVMTLLCAGVVVTSLLRRRANWFFPAAAIAAIIFIASPINADAIARLNQEQRLEAALRRNNMLAEDGSIVANADAAMDDRTIIYDSINYLLNLDAPEDSITRRLTTHFTGEAGGYAYADPEKMYELLGFTKPVASSSSYSHYWTFSGTAKSNELDSRGIAHAKWLNMGTPYATVADAEAAVADKTDLKPYYLICDRNALGDALLSAAPDFSFPDVPLTLHIEGENVLLNPLLTANETTPAYQNNDRSFDLANDRITLTSGKILHISYLNISRYRSSETTYITLCGWLLTPETE